MIIGIPKEIKTDEYRVSMTPAGVHDLIVQTDTKYWWKSWQGRAVAS